MKHTGHLKQNPTTVGNFARLIDTAVIAGTLSGSYALTHGSGERLYHYAAAGFLAAFAFLLFAEFTSLYRSYRGEPHRREIIAVIKTWVLALTVVLASGFLSKRSTVYSRVLVSSWAICAPACLILARILGRGILESARSAGMNYRTAAIVGPGAQGSALAQHIIANPTLGIRLEGLYCDHPPPYALPAGLHLKGTVADAIEQARVGALDIVYLTLPYIETEKTEEIVTQLTDSTINLQIVPRYETYDLFQSPVTMVGDIPTLSIFNTRTSGVGGVLKRAEDVALATVLLLIFSVPMLLIAAAIRLTSPGPVFFTQHRYGVDGQQIPVMKFRSMRVCEDGACVTQASRSDPRVTPCGRILRRTSLDELPQLFNVLRGTMSLVGPRPHAVAHNERYRKLIQGYMLRHKVKPGITGLAQIRGLRGATDTLEKMERRVESDLEYIRTWSLSLDMKILFTTIFCVINDKNAY